MWVHFYQKNLSFFDYIINVITQIINSIIAISVLIVLNIPKVKCKQCGHEWIPRIEDPRICPKCHSLRWDKEKR